MNSRFLVQSALVMGALLLAGTIAWAGQFGESYPEAASIGQDVRSFEELSERFVRLAQEKGGTYAFEVLRRAIVPPQTDLHLLGHVVGDELYKQKNVGGIGECTQEFRNACSHSIVIGALNEYGGEGALPLIRDACKAAPGGMGAYTMCYHGLGHGVFAYFGFSLPETIAFCAKTGTEEYEQQEYTECVGGAVMELMGGGGHDPELWQLARERYLKEETPLAPCTESFMPADVKPICLIYLTPRLLELAGASLAQPDPALFPKAFAFCDALPSARQHLRDACFGGFGKEFVPLAGARDIRNVDAFSDEEYSVAIGWCALAGAEDGVAACIRDGLASVFWGGENDPAAALRFCGLVPEGFAQDACWKRLGDDIALYVGSSERQAELCAAFPEAHRSACENS